MFQNVLSAVQQIFLYKLYPVPTVTEEQIREAELQLKGKASKKKEAIKAEYEIDDYDKTTETDKSGYNKKQPVKNFGNRKSSVSPKVKKLIKIMKTNPTKKICVAIMSGIIACKGDENHVNNGKHGKQHNANERKRQKCLVELIIEQGFQIILPAFDLLATRGDVHTDTALLHLQSPGINKRNDKNDGKKTVKQNLDGVITLDPDVRIINFIVLVSALYRTDGFTGLEPMSLGEPINTAAGNNHIRDENDLKQEEENSTHDLPIEKVAKTKDKER
jgi:hypothetical protein